MKLLAVVDYQNDFVTGVLGFPRAKSLEKKICQKIEEYHQNGDDVVFMMDTHYDDYLNTEEGRNLPIVHAVKGTLGWQLYGKVNQAVGKNDVIFMKESFGSREFGDFLKNKNYETIELIGLVTNICVISNAIIAKTFMPNAKIIVDASCTDSFDSELNEKALDVMESFHVKIENRK
ncbi:MAG: cysteine hydrolase [Bacilli bacterium]|nr:cysteine hydrolase [Bacilli bacterium]